jgi:hypothetical protein
MNFWFNRPIGDLPSIFHIQRRLNSQLLDSNSKEIYHPCINGIFQYGFESKIALTNFLSAALDLKGESGLEQVELIGKELPSSDPSFPLGYFTLDVRCRAKNGKHFLVKMTNDFRGDYHMKAFVEHSRMLSQLKFNKTMEERERRTENNKKGITHFWKDIQGVYTIVITNKVFDSKTMKAVYPNETLMEPSLINTYELRSTEQLERHYGDMYNKIILLMLSHLNKPVSELMSHIEDSAYVLNDRDLESGVKKNTRNQST